MPDRYDAIVVGAGPAGTSAAAVLGEAGRSVLLLDKSGFPREKTCGDGITYKCREALLRLGRWEAFLNSATYQTNGYSLCFSDHSQMSLRMPPGDTRYAIYICARHDFDQLLLDGALRHAGVSFRPGAQARRVVLERQSGGEQVVGVEVSTAAGKEAFFAPLVIDATGANSPIATQVGAGNRDPQKCALAIRGYYRNVRHLTHTIEIYFDPRILPGYYWVFPTSATTANVGCGTFQHIVQKQHIDLRGLMEEFRREHPVARDKLGGAELCGPLRGGKIPLGMDATASRVRNGLLLLGDAAAFVNPITAEGISYALESGIMAGEVAVRAGEKGDFSAAGLADFDRRWQEKFAAQFAKSVFLTDGLPRGAFTQYVVKAFDRSERVSAAVADAGLQYELMVKLKCMMKMLT